MWSPPYPTAAVVAPSAFPETLGEGGQTAQNVVMGETLGEGQTYPPLELADDRDTLALLDRLVKMEGIIDDREDHIMESPRWSMVENEPPPRQAPTFPMPCPQLSFESEGQSLESNHRQDPLQSWVTPVRTSASASASASTSTSQPLFESSEPLRQLPIAVALPMWPSPAPPTIGGSSTALMPPTADSHSMQNDIPPRLGGGSGRHCAERLQWSFEEDSMIVDFVREHGCKWRLIASMLEGRSDDSIRNRWNRVKDLPVHNGGHELDGGQRAARELTAPAPMSEGDKPERVSWTRIEDQVILRSVVELGHKWNKIASRLPGRTGHAIRNRFSRLQSLASRGHEVGISSGHGTPIGIQLIPQHTGRASQPRCSAQPFVSPS